MCVMLLDTALAVERCYAIGCSFCCEALLLAAREALLLAGSVVLGGASLPIQVTAWPSKIIHVTNTEVKMKRDVISQ